MPARLASLRRLRDSCSRVFDLHCGARTAANLGGEVEADETYIGGKGGFMHVAKRKRLNMTRGRSIAGKTAVMGLLDRNGKDGVSRVRTQILTSIRKDHLRASFVSMSRLARTSTPMRFRPTTD